MFHVEVVRADPEIRRDMGVSNMVEYGYQPVQVNRIEAW